MVGVSSSWSAGEGGGDGDTVGSTVSTSALTIWAAVVAGAAILLLVVTDHRQPARRRAPIPRLPTAGRRRSAGLTRYVRSPTGRAAVPPAEPAGEGQGRGRGRRDRRRRRRAFRPGGRRDPDRFGAAARTSGFVNGSGAGAAHRRRAVALAGHTGDEAVALAVPLADPDPAVRATALGALERLGILADAEVMAALGDPEAGVRRRAAEVAARHPLVSLVGALDDHPTRAVVEVAAWAGGEQAELGALGRASSGLGCARGSPITPTRSCARRPSRRSGPSAIRPGSRRSSPPVPTSPPSAAAPSSPSPHSGHGPDVDAALARARNDRDGRRARPPRTCPKPAPSGPATSRRRDRTV